jgi:hypothetical protein
MLYATERKRATGLNAKGTLSASKKKGSKATESSAGADSFPILPRVDAYEEDYAEVEFIDVLERGKQPQRFMKPTSGNQQQSGVTNVTDGGVEIERQPIGEGDKNTWVLWRRGGNFCGCCGGFWCLNTLKERNTIVCLCACGTLLVVTGALVFLVWLQSRVDAHEATMLFGN